MQFAYMLKGMQDEKSNSNTLKSEHTSSTCSSVTTTTTGISLFYTSFQMSQQLYIIVYQSVSQSQNKISDRSGQFASIKITEVE